MIYQDHAMYSHPIAMSGLQTLYEFVSKSDRMEALEEVLVFCDTNSCDGPPYIMSYYVKSDMNYDAIQAEDNTNKDMIAFVACEDTNLILQDLEEIHDRMALYQFDMIQVTRAGVVLLQITFHHRHVGRTASVDIFRYRSHLEQCLSEDQIPSGVASAFAFLFCGIVFGLVLAKWLNL